MTHAPARALVLSFAFLLISCTGDAPVEEVVLETAPAPPSTGTVRVLHASEIEWGALNPLRGEHSPRAGTLWGDRRLAVPSGFLVKFVDGFASPPHIHPVTYRGVVVRGLVHNDEPEAERRWLPRGSFWTQPAGQVHITAAQGEENVAYIEIEEGPYLVHPSDQAFDPNEQPIQMPPDTMTWTSVTGTEAVQIAELPGNPGNDQLRRSLVRLPGGFKGTLRSESEVFHVVVIEGTPDHGVEGKSDTRALIPGSYFGSNGAVTHRLTCPLVAPALLYVRSVDDFVVAD